MEDPIVLEVVDRWERRIQLTRDVWINHICTSHPEVAEHVPAIERTLRDPDLVCFDAGRPDGECFYTLGAIESIPHRLLKIAVRFPRGGDVGLVHTAYISRNIPTKERRKWQKQ